MIQKCIFTSRHSPASSKFSLSEETEPDISFIYILHIYQITYDADAAWAPVPFSGLRGKSLNFPPLSMVLVVGCLNGLYYVEICSLCTHFVECVSLLSNFDFFVYFSCKSFV